MPRKCCVPACKGNYSAGPKVSVFLFPSDEDLKEKWIKAIHRDECVPSKQSVVCELHFQSTDIERSTSVYDSKNGRLLTAPLDKPRLKKDAVPSLLPGCPSYLSRPSTSREHAQNRRKRVKNAFLNPCSSKNVTDVYPQALNVVVGDDDIHDQNENVLPILFYIGGYCSYRIIKKFKCGYCKEFICANDSEIQDDRNSFINQTSRGGLSFPSSDVLTCVSYVLTVMQKILDDNEELFLNQRSQRNILYQVSLSNIPSMVFSTQNCITGHTVHDIVHSIVQTSANILLNNYTKKLNDYKWKKTSKN